MLLSILSYDLDDYPLHLADLKIILLDERVLALQPLETARMFLLLSYNYADIFTCLADGEKLVL